MCGQKITPLFAMDNFINLFSVCTPAPNKLLWAFWFQDFASWLFVSISKSQNWRVGPYVCLHNNHLDRINLLGIKQVTLRSCLEQSLKQFALWFFNSHTCTEKKRFLTFLACCAAFSWQSLNENDIVLIHNHLHLLFALWANCGGPL